MSRQSTSPCEKGNEKKSQSFQQFSLPGLTCTAWTYVLKGGKINCNVDLKIVQIPINTAATSFQFQKFISKIEIGNLLFDIFHFFYTVQKQAPRKRCTSQPCKKKGSLRWSFHYFNYKPFVKRSNIFSNKCNRYASTKYYCVEDSMYYPIWCLISKKISPTLVLQCKNLIING